MRVFVLLVKQGADVSTRDEEGRSLLQNALEDEDRAWECLPTLLENGLYTLDSDAGDKTLGELLEERDWVYTVKDRVEGMPEIDKLPGHTGDSSSRPVRPRTPIVCVRTATLL
ncbi:uncharacterized protein BJX67DRAFT_366743 [Aspergillus lucknowensis]|uniref:Ankyrin repeat protein n=1 Tax=Aspergillus lucknowensis TaxID=176173 RepID=A0ABR4LCV2_9EURO